MKYLLIPLAIVAGPALACPDAKDAMAPADMSVASQSAPASALSKAVAAKPAPAVQARKAVATADRSSVVPARQTSLVSKTAPDQAKDKTL
jgi:hypothetical protein